MWIRHERVGLAPHGPVEATPVPDLDEFGEDHEELVEDFLREVWDPLKPRTVHMAESGVCFGGNQVFLVGGQLRGGKVPLPLDRIRALRVGREVKWQKVDIGGEVPTTRLKFSLTAVGNKFMVSGGYSRVSGEVFKDVFHLVPNRGKLKWVKTKPLPEPRHGHISIYLPSTNARPARVIVHGGYSELVSKNQVMRPRLVSYCADLVSDTNVPGVSQDPERQTAVMSWTEFLSTGDIPALGNHLGVVLNNGEAVVVMGGALVTPEGKRSRSSGVYVLDVVSSTWSRAESVGDTPTGTTSHQLVAVPNENWSAFCFGGYRSVAGGKISANGDQLLLQIQRHSSSKYTAVWKDVSEEIENPPCPRSSHSMVAVAGRIVVVGGRNGTEYLGDVHSLPAQELRDLLDTELETPVEKNKKPFDLVNQDGDEDGSTLPPPPLPASSQPIQKIPCSLQEDPAPPESHPEQKNLSSELSSDRHTSPTEKPLNAFIEPVDSHSYATNLVVPEQGKSVDSRPPAETQDEVFRAKGSRKRLPKDVDYVVETATNKGQRSKQRRVEFTRSAKLASLKKDALVQMVQDLQKSLNGNDEQLQKCEDEMKKMRSAQIRLADTAKSDIARLRQLLVEKNYCHTTEIPMPHQMVTDHPAVEDLEHQKVLYKDVQDKLYTVEEELKSTRDELKRERENVIIKKQDVDRFSDALKKAKSQINEKEKLCKAACREKDASIAEVHGLRNRITERDSLLVSQQKDLSRVRSKQIELEAALANYEGTVSNLLGETSDLNARLSEAERSRDETETLQAKQKNEFAQLQKDCAAHEEMQIALQEQVKVVQDKRNEVENQLADVLSNTEALSSRVESLKSDSQKMASDLRTVQTENSLLRQNVVDRDRLLALEQEKARSAEAATDRMRLALVSIIDRVEKEKKNIKQGIEQLDQEIRVARSKMH